MSDSLKQKKIDIFAVNRDIISLYKRYFFYLLFAGILLTLLSLVLPQVNTTHTDFSEIIADLKLAVILAIVTGLVNTITTAILLWFIDQKEQGVNVSLASAIKQALPRTPSFYIAGLAVGIVVTVGLVLLVIPGIIWGLMFSQTALFVLLKNQGVRSAFSSSKKLTKGYFWTILRINIQILIPTLLVLLLGWIASLFLNPTIAPLFDNILSTAFELFLGQLAIVFSYATWRALNTAQAIDQK